MSQPLVSCIMVTGKSPSRLPLAMAACRSYAQQTYPAKEIVIVNTGDNLLGRLPAELTDNICEVTRPAELTLGELRNCGLEAAQGEFVCQWDDDDWSGPQRIELQLAAALEHNCPTTLLSQVRYSFMTDTAFVVRQTPRPEYAVGLPGTVLHARTELRYLPERKSEDTHFVKQFERVHILDNPPELYLRFCHGLDQTWTEKHIMQRYYQTRGQRRLPKTANDYLDQVLKQYYKGVAARQQ